MRVAFLVNDLQLSGGVGVVVQHARQLAAHHGFDVTLVLAREEEAPSWAYERLEHLHVAALPDARAAPPFDVAVATWWETTFSLFEVPAQRYAFFVQSLEDRFYTTRDAARMGAGMTLDLPVTFLTEAGWIRDTLAQIRPDAPCLLVRNGIDKGVFTPPERLEPRLSDPLRVLVEGNPRSWFKHVHEAIDAVAAMREPHHLTVVCGDRQGLGDVPADRVIGPLTSREMANAYAESDVLVKLSSVEGMYGPPLEAMHAGTTCVTTPVTGHEEYVRHRVNALVCDWDDPTGTARLLDLLARDRRLLHELRCGALETARAWPDWERQGALMALALRRVRSAEPPPAHAPAPAMLADLRAGVEAYALHLDDLEAAEFEAGFVRRLRKTRVAARLRRARDQRWARALTWPIRRASPGTMRRLLK